jgi:NAD(P)-dependent dehydrogenase (short-subunit alcohol dehydrogenase family)
MSPEMSTVSLVTGGNRGIGREVCRQLAELGHVVLLTTRSADAAAVGNVAGWDRASRAFASRRPASRAFAPCSVACALPSAAFARSRLPVVTPLTLSAPQASVLGLRTQGATATM